MSQFLLTTSSILHAVIPVSCCSSVLLSSAFITNLPRKVQVSIVYNLGHNQLTLCSLKIKFHYWNLYLNTCCLFQRGIVAVTSWVSLLCFPRTIHCQGLMLLKFFFCRILLLAYLPSCHTNVNIHKKIDTQYSFIRSPKNWAFPGTSTINADLDLMEW